MREDDRRFYRETTDLYDRPFSDVGRAQLSLCHTTIELH